MQVPNHQQQELSSAYLTNKQFGLVFIFHRLGPGDEGPQNPKALFGYAKFLQPLHQGSQIRQHARAGARWCLANGFLAHQDVTLR